RIQQAIPLPLVSVEQARVIGERMGPSGAHSHGYTAAQAALLVALAPEATTCGYEIQERGEAGRILVAYFLIGPGRPAHHHPFAGQRTHATPVRRTASRLLRTMALCGSSSSARDQHRSASTGSCRLKRRFPSLSQT